MNAAFDAPAGLGPGLSDDEALELQIETARLATLTPDREIARAAARTMAELIAMRSPEQVERMERAKGLR